jgi:hypothetical protein
MRKSRLLPFLGCTVVTGLVLLSSSQRLAAQQPPVPQLSSEQQKRIEAMQKTSKDFDRAMKEWERSKREESHGPPEMEAAKYFVQNPVGGVLACAGGVFFAAFVILFSLLVTVLSATLSDCSRPRPDVPRLVE